MTTTRLRKGARYTFAALAIILVACVVVQVGLAGLAVMSDANYWAWHRNFVHTFELAPVLLLIAAAVGKARAKLLWMSALPFVLISLQYVFLGLRPSPIAALHVVNALAVFGVASYLAWASIRSATAWRNA